MTEGKRVLFIDTPCSKATGLSVVTSSHSSLAVYK